jgi:hypothetical protein
VNLCRSLNEHTVGLVELLFTIALRLDRPKPRRGGSWFYVRAAYPHFYCFTTASSTVCAVYMNARRRAAWRPAFYGFLRLV